MLVNFLGEFPCLEWLLDSSFSSSVFEHEIWLKLNFGSSKVLYHFIKNPVNPLVFNSLLIQATIYIVFPISQNALTTIIQTVINSSQCITTASLAYTKSMHMRIITSISLTHAHTNLMESTANTSFRSVCASLINS